MDVRSEPPLSKRRRRFWFSFHSGARALTRFVPTPPFPRAAQKTKRQGKRAGHDRIQALELRQGLPRRQRLGRFGTSREPAFSSVPLERDARRRAAPLAAMNNNRHLYICTPGLFPGEPLLRRAGGGDYASRLSDGGGGAAFFFETPKTLRTASATRTSPRARSAD